MGDGKSPWCRHKVTARVGASADAPLARDNDNPAAPNNGTAQARRFRFEVCFACDMVESSHVFDFQTPCATHEEFLGGRLFLGARLEEQRYSDLAPDKGVFLYEAPGRAVE